MHCLFSIIQRCKSVKRTVVSLLLALTGFLLPAHAALQSGPMLSHVDMREAIIWLQADRPSTLAIRYNETGTEKKFLSEGVQVSHEHALTATIRLDRVEPGRSYNYEILQDGAPIDSGYKLKTPDNYYFRAPPPDFSFAVGGAHYVTEEGFEPPYQILGGGYNIFEVIRNASPEFMLWAGNTAHIRRSDFTSRSGIFKRFSHARNIPELKQLLSDIPHYAVWSKADYGFHNDGKYSSYRRDVETAFKAFWPRPVTVPTLEGIASRFRYADVDFFMLDVRSYRDELPNTRKLPEVLGKAQIEWLRQELIRSDATFKIILSGSPVLNPANSPENLSHADSEHNALLEALRRERISGLFFISGGKYSGELTKLVHASNYNLYDITVGPLTANPNTNHNELNYFRVPSTSTAERQFALFQVSGTEENRQLKIQTINILGDVLWSRTIRAAELQLAESLSK
ncbi:MAG: hypothetical protein CNE95_03785 [Puniceicoccaceae bacterium MED-G30]|nr:MAG: hypothetical protein CNE95_03785 [Puniceicoccaceae bacterium MED-G30]